METKLEGIDEILDFGENMIYLYDILNMQKCKYMVIHQIPAADGQLLCNKNELGESTYILTYKIISRKSSAVLNRLVH